MKKAEVTFKFLTPALLAGADQKSAEIRASSIRGALRWWMNALGYDKDCINDLFGTAAGETGRRSRVIVRDTTTNTQVKLQSAKEIIGNSYDYFLWPLGKPENARGVIQAGTTASFSVFLRSGESEDLEKGLKAFLLLGSLGSRSRRCYGSIWPVSVTIDGHAWKFPETIPGMREVLLEILGKKKLKIDIVGGIMFPKYHSAIDECSDFLSRYRRGKTKYGLEASYWGEKDHYAPFGKTDCVYRPALGLPLTQTYSSTGRTVTSQIEGYDRLASPVHFKVVSLNGNMVPIVIFFSSMLPPKGTKVKLVNKNSGNVIKTLPLNFELFNYLKTDDELVNLYNGD